MRKFAVILFTGLLCAHGACLASELEIEAAPEPASGPALARSQEEEISNLTWFFYPEPQGDRLLIRRDVGVVVRPKQDGKASAFSVKLANISPVGGRDAADAAVIFTLAESDGEGMAEHPLLRATGKLPEGLGSGDCLVLRFPAVELKGGADYVALLEFAKPAPTRKLNLATTRAEKGSEVSGILRVTNEDTPEPRWERSKGSIVFVLGGE